MKNMERWLGDGGMAIIGAIGARFEAYGMDELETIGSGWCSGTWVPEALACNPHGIVQAGVHSVLLDAAMNFAINTGLNGKDRTKATLEMKAETMKVARAGDHLTFRGEVVRETKQVAFAEARISGEDGALISRSTATFLLHRADP